MPDTFGKRERKKVQERKAAAREERRLARTTRRESRPAEVPELELLTAPAPPPEEPMARAEGAS